MTDATDQPSATLAEALAAAEMAQMIATVKAAAEAGDARARVQLEFIELIPKIVKREALAAKPMGCGKVNAAADGLCDAAIACIKAAAVLKVWDAQVPDEVLPKVAEMIGQALLQELECGTRAGVELVSLPQKEEKNVWN